ncbi:MAG: CGNR zinc finger domain-containing protein [Solirubrobacteraceae bacterium]
MPAHYEVVEGLRVPARISGHPALDFCNTWAGWDGHAAVEYLADYEHLVVWAGFVGILSRDQVPVLRHHARGSAGAAASVLECARAFRANLYAVLRDPACAPAWPAVADQVAAAARTLHLHRADETIRWEIAPAADLSAPLAAAAWSAGELLTSPALHRVRACAGPGCGWLFLDPTGRRRWCVMAVCGNREKARRFAAKRKDPA